MSVICPENKGIFHPNTRRTIGSYVAAAIVGQKEKAIAYLYYLMDILPSGITGDRARFIDLMLVPASWDKNDQPIFFEDELRGIRRC